MKHFRPTSHIYRKTRRNQSQSCTPRRLWLSSNPFDHTASSTPPSVSPIWKPYAGAVNSSEDQLFPTANPPTVYSDCSDTSIPTEETGYDNDTSDKVTLSLLSVQLAKTVHIAAKSSDASFLAFISIPPKSRFCFPEL